MLQAIQGVLRVQVLRERLVLLVVRVVLGLPAGQVVRGVLAGLVGLQGKVCMVAENIIY